MRVAPTVVLSPEERAQLRRWRSGAGARRQRAAIVLLAAAGRQDLEIARSLSIDRQTAARWRRRFLRGRAGALAGVDPVARPGRIAEERLQAVVRATLSAPSRGYGRRSTRQLAAEFGVSHMTVRRLWQSYGLRPTAFPDPVVRADPTPPLVPWDVVGVSFRGSAALLALTLHPPVGDALPSPAPGRFSGDERRSSEPGAGSEPTRPALRRLEPPPPPHARSAAPDRFRTFADAVAARVGPSIPVRLVATARSESDRRWFDRWRVRHPRFEFDESPDLAGWRERAGRAIEALGRGSRPRGQYRGRAEVSVALRRSLATYDGRTADYEWIAPGAMVSAGEAAYRLRYDLAVTGRAEFKPPGAGPPAMSPEEPPLDSDRASARAILRQNLRVRPGERVTIEAWTATLSYGNAFVLESLRLGARPLLLYQDEPTYWAAATEVPSRALGSVGEHRRAALERTDVFVSFLGPSDRERFHSLPSPTLFRLGEYQDALYAAAAKAGARAVQMAVGRVSAASARMYHVEPEAWREELVSGTLVSPATLGRRAARIVRALTRGRAIEIRHPNGTQLALRLQGRAPAVSDGRVGRAARRADWSLVTLPAGVVTVALDERFAEGTFRSNVRCSTGLSDSVGDFSDGRWTFAEGRLRRFQYEIGQDLFEQSYGRAREGRDRPGTLSIGVNERIVSAPLLEDQSIGTVTLQIGRNDHVGGHTRASWWAWSLLRGATVLVDGTPVLNAGKLAS